MISAIPPLSYSHLIQKVQPVTKISAATEKAISQGLMNESLVSPEPLEKSSGSHGRLLDVLI